MVQFVVSVLPLLVLIRMSLRANVEFRKEARLPMQWSLGGAVNWTAPRPIALSFTPLLAALTLLALALLGTVMQPRPGQEGYVLPTLVAIGLTFVAVHSLHLHFIRRTLKQRRR